MKLEANVTFKKLVDGITSCHVDVDADYVFPYESDIYKWVANELAEKFGCSFGDDEFEIENLEDLMDNWFAWS